MELTYQEKRPRIMITMRCQFKCSYCSIPYCEISEVDGNYWIDLINSMPYTEVIFSGGEPLVYKDLFKIIDNIQIPYRIYTNLRFWRHEYIDLIDPEKCFFYISYHPNKINSKIDFVEKVINLKKNGYKLNVHYINTNCQEMEDINYVIKMLAKENIEMVCDRNQREIKLIRNDDYCHIDRTLFGPDGKRYPCIGFLREQKNDIPLTHYMGMNCKDTYCLPCDIDVMMKK